MSQPIVSAERFVSPVPGDMIEPRLRRFHRYWWDRCVGDLLPGRARIDPLDFPWILGEVLLVDVLRDPLDFRIRLHGARLARRAGYDLTGRMVADLPDPGFRALARESFTIVTTTALPLLSRRNRVIAGRLHHYETLMLPLATDGASVDMLMIALVYPPDP